MQINEHLLAHLDVCHSFHRRLRIFSGGHKTLKEFFITENKLKKLKKSYPIYCMEMNIYYKNGKCIFDEKNSLNQIGRSVVQELLGWVNKK